MDAVLNNLYNILFHTFNTYLNQQKEKLTINKPTGTPFSTINVLSADSKMESCQAGNGPRTSDNNHYSIYITSSISFIFAALVTLVVYKLSLLLIKVLIRNLTVSAHVYGDIENYYRTGKSYHMILTWLSENVNSFPHFGVNLKKKKCSSSKEATDVKTCPSFGIHYFQYKGCWIQIHRKQTPKVAMHHVPFESLTLTTLKGNKDVLDELLNDAKGYMKCDTDDKTTFYYIACGDWNEFGEPKRRRQFESVIMGTDIKENIRTDILEFIDSEEWYVQRGIPYRRGYMLYGPPGCGKSSFIKAIAGEIGYNICMLSLSTKDLSDDQLNELMNTAPEKSIILLEDIDAAFKSRESDNSSSKETSLAFEGAGASKVTFRGLLNALDGVASTEGRIVFLTTNYINRLDPALIRPGRVDVKVLVDLPDLDQVERMFARFYPEAEKMLKIRFGKLIMGLEKQKISMAMIQGLFMKHKLSALDAIENAEKYFDEQYFSVVKTPKCETETENKASTEIENKASTETENKASTETENKANTKTAG